MTFITPIGDLGVEGAAELAAKYGTVERFLSSVADWQDVIPGLQRPGGPADPADADADAAADPRAALLRALAAPGAPLAPAPADGVQLLRRAVALQVLPTGCDAVDDMLMGGLRQGLVCEVAGETASGKTQLCLQAAALRATQGERVLYVDTTNGFSAARVAALCAAQRAAAAAADGQAPPAASDARAAASDAALDNISVVRPHSVHALMSCLDELSRQLARGPAARCLLVIDSVSAVLAPVVGAQMHTQGQVLVGAIGSMLRHIAAEYSIAVLITNHVVGGGGGGGGDGAAAGGGAAAAGGGGGPAGGGGFRPALGAQWRGQPHCRIQLARPPQAGGAVVATLTASQGQAAGAQAAFVVTDAGLETLPSA
ncbi:DNA repair protein RAD51 [Raphidocelis subcapitata]|uniref:DNA repair protein RAD51 n=1 Tax=Raphidocelis subcapitata TaxID=307507 RepID=A0A2V0P445_9CHLO|nr:DNA repair protein RAD51 [Raphidocelis subcapitata]|eukprot:GBF92623.1 DNA repair protein RAD51 [Raphidocelis subcapitata]